MKLLVFFCFFVAGVRASAQVPLYVPHQGLTAWWSLDSGNKGSDEVGSELGGTTSGSTGVTWITDRFGNPYSAGAFDSGYVDKSDLPEYTNAVSVSAWVKLADVTTDQRIAGYVNFGMDVVNGMVQATIVDGAGRSTVFAAGEISPGAWTHIAFTYYTYDSIRIYINGVQVGTKQVYGTIGIQDGFGDFYLGKQGLPREERDIDDAGIWNLQLSPSQIAQLFRSDSTYVMPACVPRNGLLAWYPFNGNAHDESGNGRDGLVNGPVMAPDRDSAFSRAYRFNGTSFSSPNTCDFISAGIPNLPVGTGPRSFSVWTEGGGVVFCYGNTDNMEFSSLTSDLEGRARYNEGDDNGEFGTSDTNYSLRWTHLVYTYDGSIGRIYVNGVMKASSKTPNNNTLSDFLIGAYGAEVPGIGFGCYSGSIDDIGVWNRALTASEVAGLYSGQASSMSPAASGTILGNPLVYPNPARTEITLKTNAMSAGTSYIIIDPLGRMALNGSINEGEQSIDVHALPDGLYLIRTKEGLSQKFLIVRN